MTQQEYTVYRDSEDGTSTTSKQFKFDPDETLDKVRTAMGSYITDDYRFINYQNHVGTYSDMILSMNFEDVATLKKVVGLKNQLYLTNVTKTVKTDLVGFNTNWFFDRYMSCQIALNTESNAQSLNQGKMPPLMLTNVKATNPDLKGFGTLGNVVVCEKDSIIQFNLSSWGAAAYGYSIKPEAGTPITDNQGALFISFSGCTPNNYAGTGLQRYSSNNAAIDKKMIQVVPTSSMKIGGDKVLQYMKFTIRTWIVTEYKTKDGKTITCNQPIPTPQVHHPLARAARFAMFFETTGNSGGTPYGQLTGAKQQVTVPGNSIQPASTAPAEQQSSQPFGDPVYDLKMDNSPSGIIGEVTFYIFVFNSHAEAMAVFSGINDIDPNVWKA
ncbi:MAG: hypothetical protein NW224_14675 [Leptolyngbyaceae cyanobacterium bins.302]|nr:hypothetical protein [Leptolyngbyaceae cyanobacterium bins.302]